MTQLKIKLTSISDVQTFVNAVSRFSGDIDLRSGRYVVDAKSIMGIFSLDLSKPLELRVHSDDCDELMAELDKYIIK